LWGKLSALGIIMILISTVLVLLAMHIGNFYKRRQGTM
jgi:iron(III) transport system permease protein